MKHAFIKPARIQQLVTLWFKGAELCIQKCALLKKNVSAPRMIKTAAAEVSKNGRYHYRSSIYQHYIAFLLASFLWIHLKLVNIHHKTLFFICQVSWKPFKCEETHLNCSRRLHTRARRFYMKSSRKCVMLKLHVVLSKLVV